MSGLPLPHEFDYSVFGLRIRSELKLPELAAAADGGAPDVQIRCGGVPSVAKPGVHAIDGGALLRVRDVGSYLVRGGSEIVVDPLPSVPEQNIRLFLLGSAMGLILHQRQLLPLHANAVEIGGKAVAFMGASGQGKSTLAAWFLDHGFQVVADDVCVVRFDSTGRPVVSPGLPRLRLWKEALEASGRQPADYVRSYGGAKKLEKYDVPVTSHSAAEELQLGVIYLLRRGQRFIQQLHGVEAVEAVMANTYRGRYVSVVGDARAHFQSSLKLVERIPVFEVFRRWDLSEFSNEVREILAHATKVLRVPPSRPDGD